MTLHESRDSCADEPDEAAAQAAIGRVDGSPLSVGQHVTISAVVELNGRDGARTVLDELAGGAVVVLEGDPTGAAGEGASRLVDALLPPLQSVPGRGAVLQIRRNAADRYASAEDFGLLTAPEVAQRAASRATNQSATAHRWRSRREVFAVSWQGTTVYPGFQFDDDGRPFPVIAQVLAVVGDDGSGWPLALWFTGADGWLDGHRPVDLLHEDPDAVVEAARRSTRGPAV